MNQAEFDAMTVHLTDVFRKQGAEAAVVAQDQVNDDLISMKQYLSFQGPKEGNYLAFFLHDLNTSKELFRITRRWVS
jgi:hypothetical protein